MKKQKVKYSELQSEFIKNYCNKSKITEKQLIDLGLFAMPCDCEDGGGKGHWAMIKREFLRDQIELYIK